LDANATGTATVLFIPTKYAAPDKPEEWSFGGTLSYIDPYTGLEVTRELYPVTLTVKPCPELDLTYFMQRDVYGDDALTLDVIEPMKPAEFALLINNKGYGDATNVRMVTQQPEIIENEKGLYIDFELISSQVNGGDAALSFGQSIANDFGTIPAHSQMYAQWWLTSTLLGHFTDYKVEASHITSYDNPDLSLIDQVSIHELIHSLDLSTSEKNMRGFLVNDIADANDLPDKLYLTNGDIADVVQAVTAKVEMTSSTTCLLTITPSAIGWNYGSILDPTNGFSTIKSMVRQSDGKEIVNVNFWQTDRTLRDGKDWLYENRLHFADNFATASQETYILTFDPVPDVVLSVESIEPLPEEGTIAEADIDELMVKFNKAIDKETFTGDDITFNVQGVKQDASKIGITTADNQTFTLDMSQLNSTLSNGYYTLTVQTADITDSEGFNGKTGKQVGWILFRGGLVQLLTSTWPENSGTVTRKASEPASIRGFASSGEDPNTARYASTVILVAEPSEGYEFANWTQNGEIVSTDAEYETIALGDMDIVANFKKKSYMVNIATTALNGSIEGTGTGIYEHGTKIELEAVPATDFMFTNWTVNGEIVETDGNTLTLTADKSLDIEATFIQEYYRQSLTMSKGWNWISAYLGEPLPITDFSQNVNRILGQTDELINDPEYGLVGNIKELSVGKAYKIETNRLFTNSFRGHLYDASTNPVTLHKGWNWVGYPYMEKAQIDVITNAEEGDYVTSQTGFAEYADGNWEGTLDTFMPGEGYLYKSASEKDLTYDTSMFVSASRALRAKTATVTEKNIDIHLYPNTMNVTARIYRDGIDVSDQAYNIYALAGNELRGVGLFVGQNHYLTIYGDGATEISFVVENAVTGDTYVADETLTFRSDVVGSRKSPFAINIGDATGIDVVGSDKRPMTVYSLQGVLISREATLKMLHSLPKGVYIING
ncbi:MAG: secretion protein Por, partial [Prevotella sp.]|nr:secretion protein Por [Prevotella sp.]